jgi:hypothetical protein
MFAEGWTPNCIELGQAYSLIPRETDARQPQADKNTHFCALEQSLLSREASNVWLIVQQANLALQKQQPQSIKLS